MGLPHWCSKRFADWINNCNFWNQHETLFTSHLRSVIWHKNVGGIHNELVGCWKCLYIKVLINTRTLRSAVKYISIRGEASDYILKIMKTNILYIQFDSIHVYLCSVFHNTHRFKATSQKMNVTVKSGLLSEVIVSKYRHI